MSHKEGGYRYGGRRLNHCRYIDKFDQATERFSKFLLRKKQGDNPTSPRIRWTETARDEHECDGAKAER